MNIKQNELDGSTCRHVDLEHELTQKTVKKYLTIRIQEAKNVSLKEKYKCLKKDKMKS